MNKLVAKQKCQLKDSCIYHVVKDQIDNGLINEIEISDGDYLTYSFTKIKNKTNYVGGYFPGHYSEGDNSERKFVDENNNEYYIVCFDGGENGNGDWQTYFTNLSLLIGSLKEYFETWVISIQNDVADDVHYVYVGLRKK